MTDPQLDSSTPARKQLDNSPPPDSFWAMITARPSLVTILGAVAIFLLSIVAYIPAMRAGFIWDDDSYVTNNLTLTNLDGLQRIWFERGATVQYYPLVFTSFWIEHHLWDSGGPGFNSIGYHVVNVLLHGLGAVLLWTLLRRLSIPGAWAAAAIWALHPVQVESVAWITERKNVLSGVFFFATLIVYLRYCGITPSPTKRAEGEREHWFALPDEPMRIYVLALLLFACALLSKSVTTTLPAAVLVIIWWKRGKLALSDVTPLLPMFAMGLVMSANTAWMEHQYIGAQGAAWHYSNNAFGEGAARCIIAGRVVWFYALKLLAPYPLIFNYPRWNISPSDIWEYLFPVGVIAILIALWGLRKPLGRGPLAATLLFVGMLALALGFVNVFPMRYSFVADHFQYHASAALIVLIVASLKRGADWLVARDVLNSVAAPAAAVVLIVVLGIMTASQTLVYRDLRTLWEDTLKKNTHSWMASNNYGVMLLKADLLDQATLWFNRTIKLKHDHAEAHQNLALIAEKRGAEAAAKHHPQQAENLYQQSLDLYREASDLQPPNTFAHMQMQLKIAEMLYKLGHRDEAFKVTEEVVQADPKNEVAQVNLGRLLSEMDRPEESVAHYIAAIKLNPNSLPAHYNLGGVYKRLNKPDLALQEYARVIELDQTNPDFVVAFGTAMIAAGHPKQAEPIFKHALELDPKCLDAYLDLGLLYQFSGQLDQSAEQLEIALKLSPGNERIQAALDRTKEWIRDPSKRPTTMSLSVPATAPSSQTTMPATFPAR